MIGATLSSGFLILLYVAAMWWLQDRGRTPVAALVCKSLADVLHPLSVVAGQVAWSLDCRAYALIKRRSLS